MLATRFFRTALGSARIGLTQRVGQSLIPQAQSSVQSSFQSSFDVKSVRWMSQSAERLAKKRLPDKKRPGSSLMEEDRHRHRNMGKKEMAKKENLEVDESDYVSRVISVDAVRKTTKGGRVNRFRALVVCGNGKGAAGFAFGKGDTVRVAIQKAYHGAKKRWVAIDLSEDNGLYHDVMGKFNNSRVLLRSCRPYNGLVAGGVVRGVLECFGIENSTTKVIGRKTASSVVYATFDALSKHSSPEEVSQSRGRKVIRETRWTAIGKYPTLN